MATAESKTHKKSVRNSEHTAFRVGEKVEWKGQLAKVIAFGYLEQTANPGEDISFSKDLEAHLQLPATAPGGKPDVARHVPAAEITSLRSDPARQRELEVQFNALFGDPVPVEPSKESVKGPEIRKPGTITKAIAAKGEENPTPLRTRTSVQEPDTATTTTTVDPVTTPATKTARTARAPRTSSRKAAK